jgi:hypothetical protein
MPTRAEEVVRDSEARACPEPWNRFERKKTVVARCGPDLPVKHLFAPCLHLHQSGQMLLVCRWDPVGESEGDATNAQALYFSRDGGATWELAPRAGVTLSAGSSFDRPSSITHGWIDEDRRGCTWIYYTINQPFTWGEGRPDRSTGGGEIRRVEVLYRDETWQIAGPSEVVWAFRRPLPDGRGGICDNVRTVAWSGILRLRSGVVLMPVGGRATTDTPRGVFAPLNRVWVLRSVDDGRTWNDASLVAGGDALCVAEPTMVELSTDGELACLLRVQYDTGNELYRTVSRDAGRTWSKPFPTGLPQCDRQGVKPFLLHKSDGRYILIQTNEHESTARTNLAVFFTDEAGLCSDRWPVHRTLHVGHRSGWWPGSCYGWLAEDRDGSLWASWTCHDAQGGALYVAKLDDLEPDNAPLVEPNGIADERGDFIPRQCDRLAPSGERSFLFCDVRGRLTTPRFGLLEPAEAIVISLYVWVVRLPEKGVFRLLRLTCRNGRDEVGTLCCDHRGWHWNSEDGWDHGLRVETLTDRWVSLRCQVSLRELRVAIDSEEVLRRTIQPGRGLPTGLQFGGGAVACPCEIVLGGIGYEAGEGVGS